MLLEGSRVADRELGLARREPVLNLRLVGWVLGRALTMRGRSRRRVGEGCGRGAWNFSWQKEEETPVGDAGFIVNLI